MKASDLLKKQHREVKALFKKVEGTENARERRALMEEISAKLAHHTRIEEEIYYPAVRTIETKKATDMVLEAYEEHHVVKLVLAELPTVDPEADTFVAKMTVLKELIEHHVKEEEEEMFPMADKKLGEARNAELASQMQAEQQEAA